MRGDYETAIATLNEANQIDATRDLIWFKLGDAYRMSAPKQTDPDEKKKRYEEAAADLPESNRPAHRLGDGTERGRQQ